VNALDYSCIVICAGFLITGAVRGLLRSISSLAALLAGLYCAKKIEPFLSQMLAVINLPNPRQITAYILGFFCIFLCVKVLIFFVHKQLKTSVISVADRVFGAMLGLAKGVVVAVLVCTVLQLALPRDSAIVKNSVLLPYSNMIAASAREFLPESVHRYLHRA
jgi:membrane protein required for colicin V production